MVLVPTSPVFEDGGRIPNLYTCPGPNLSPPLTWDEVPGDVLSFALTCEDPDAPKGTFHHWAVYDIPAYARELPEGFGNAEHGNIRQARNGFGKIGWGGPCPPPGHGEHRYVFRLFALGVENLPVGDAPTCADIAEAADTTSSRRRSSPDSSRDRGRRTRAAPLASLSLGISEDSAVRTPDRHRR